MESSIRRFSLLSPNDSTAYFQLSDSTANDLSIDFLAAHLSHEKEEQPKLRHLLMQMPVDPAIISYRQAIYKDLKNAPKICEKMQEIFDAMQFYTMDVSRSIYEKSSIWELVTRLRSLQNYVSSISQLQTLLKGCAFSSDGMRTLVQHIETISTESGFAELAKDLEMLGDDIDGIRSMTLGVNFDSEFYPHEVGIISLNPYAFGEKGMLERFLQFHRQKKASDAELTPFTMITHEKKPSAAESPLMNNLTQIVERMLPTATRKLHKILKKYTDVSGMALARLGDELMFYLRFIELEKKLGAADLPTCIPECSENDTIFSDLYNVKLAICHLEGTVENHIICNDMAFTKSQNILILTGPNHGGKTILTQGVGLALLLFQQGVCVPCSGGRIALCDGIYTHFPADENQTVALGRLGEESERFRIICQNATSESLLLFNESFATTSHTESLYIAQDVLKYLCCLGARTCFNTHMHELAEHTEQLRCEQSVCGAASVVMGQREGEDAYRIRYEKPDGKSYAHDIALQYGITFEQLLGNL
ncbi:MAG: hypothetical protein E7504_07190 [Ruminococcus sp.]|nr:hypothetical protein [Ruminococcus sp.]